MRIVYRVLNRKRLELCSILRTVATKTFLTIFWLDNRVTWKSERGKTDNRIEISVRGVYLSEM